MRSLTLHRGRAIDLEGKRLSEVLPRLRRQTLDAEVELSFKRRVYNGRRSGDTFRCRLVAVWNEERRRYHLYLTNIGPEVFSAEEVASLYSMRWEVELCFCELKSQYALDEFRTTNANIVEALIWSAPLTLVASRRLHNLVRGRAPPTLRPRYTQMLWAIQFREAGMYLRGLVLAHLGLEPFSEKERVIVHQCLTENALSRDVHRQRFREAWSS